MYCHAGPVFAAGIVAALIAMEHQARGGSAQLPGHLKRPDCKHRIREIRYCPPYLYAGKQIQYYRQICLSFACPLIVLLLIGCVALPSDAQQYPNEISPSCRLNVTSRRRDINLFNSTSQTEQNLARHHVISARTLRDFYTTARSNSGRWNNYHEERQILTVLSNLSGATHAFYQLHPNPMILNETMQLLTSLNNTATFEDLQNIENPHNITNTQRLINHLLVWMPFNIFEGPRSRSDDPGPNFEYAAAPIIGNVLWGQLQTINFQMINYFSSGDVTIFDNIISGLIKLIVNNTWHSTVYNSSQWEQEKNGSYHIKRENQSRSSKRKREINRRYNLDPYCFITEQFLTYHGEEILHITIAAKAFERAKYGIGFFSVNYNSWKDWYVGSDWTNSRNHAHGIIQAGRDMAQHNNPRESYGYKFKDGSFAVGIIGDDVKYGNDNWKTLAGSNWGTGTEYAGQIFFDLHGQPVAIVITGRYKALLGNGWSFIYNNGKWEYESEDDWNIRRFTGSTLSLDSHAPRFIVGNKVNKTIIDIDKHIHDELKR